jgi:hypothetical protein
MSAEAGHHPNRIYHSQDGDLHLNGAKVFDANEVDITSTLNGVATAAVAGTAEASKVPVLGAGKDLDVLTVTTLTDTKEIAGVGASTAAAGNDNTNAGALPAGTAKIYPTTAADDTKGVIIDVADKVTGRVLLIGNGVSNKILKVYPPSGGTINGAAANAAFSSASGGGVIIVCLSSAGNTWLAW